MRGFRVNHLEFNAWSKVHRSLTIGHKRPSISI